MKKLILTLIIGLIGITLFAQTEQLFNPNLKIIKKFDIMDDKTTYSINEQLMVSENGKVGFILWPQFEPEGNGFNYTGLVVLAAGVGACHEDSYVTILLEDDSKVKLTMWNSFNCDGKIFVDLHGTALNSLNKPLKTIRLSNGYSYQEYTMDIVGNNKYYFMDCIKLFNSQKSTTK